jgi:amino acid adenylation domain-containing protein
MQTIGLKGAHLSQLQSRRWYWLQEQPQRRVQGALAITGELEPGILQQALQQVVDRHEILRTTFTHVPGMELPMQVIGKESKIACPLIDLEQLSPETQKAAQEEYWRELFLRPFDLEHGPLLYAVVLRLSPQSHILIVSLHALCADVVTLKQLGPAILQAYALSLHIRDRDEEDDPLQYVHVTAWLNELLQEEEAEEQFVYWRKVDLSLLNSMPLPFERKEESARRKRKNSVQTAFTSGQITIPLPAPLQKRLQVLGQHLDVSTEAMLLAAWQMLIWRLTEKSDILVGLHCDGRPYEELADLLGPCAQIVPISTSLPESSTFAWVAQQVQQSYEQSLEKQLYFSWGTVAEHRRELSYFPITFAYDVWPEPTTTGPLTISLQRQECGSEPFNLHLHAWQSDTVIKLQFAYDATLFSERQMRYLASMFIQLLTAVTDQPGAGIGVVALLTQEQQVEQSERLRGPKREWPFVPLHRLFEEQVRRQPGAPALRCGSVLLSYELLDQQANQLAHAFVQHGFSTGGRVALCLPRDHWTIIGLLAVLKAGGTYVPFDMQMPTVRLHDLLNQLKPDVVLSSQALQDQLPSLNVPVLCVEGLPNLLPSYPATPPPIEVWPDDLAYMMYTSGSTGVPKGVLIRQCSVSNYTQALCELLEVQAGWHFATVSSLSADLGNTVIFCGLASGGCVHVLPYEQITDAAAFSDYARQYPIDVLKIVPTHLQTLLMAGSSEIVPRERLILGGEALPWLLVEQLQQLQPSCRLYNHYGPTETTIGVLVHPLGPIQQIKIPAPEERGSSVPIGHPIANTYAYILDEQQQWTPAGTVGELYIAGTALATGYQPEPTQSGFVELELEGNRQRLYRTGDWVREVEPGVLEFVGRRDAQVKLRGYRMELGEIEAHLRKLPEVRDAVMQLRTDEQIEPYLVGYIVPWKRPGPSSQEVKEALAQYLPSYLVPKYIVNLEQLPLSANGKLDRRRLPVPDPEAEEQRQVRQIEEAQTPIEEVMQQIWRQVLAVREIGRNDNFFQLGGHSLLGTRMIAQVRAAFGVEVPITWLFEAPTVAGLSWRIEETLQQGQSGVLPPIVAVSHDQQLLLSFAQQRLWFLDQLEPGSTAYIVPIALWLRGNLQAQALQQSLGEIIHRHEVLRTTFATQEGQPVQIIHPASLTPVIWVDLTALPESERLRWAQRLAQEDVENSFDLQRGPLLRVHLLRLATQEHVLLLTMHHAISDAWSREIWLHEFSTLYTGWVNNTPVMLSPLPVQYADYALWQQQWLQQVVWQEQLDYWRQQLAGLTPLELPTDHPRPPIQTFRGGQRQLLISAELGQQLQELAQQEGVTLFMVLLAAFQVLLARYTGQQDIAVGTPIANRSRQETEGLIGFFTNTLVLRSNLAGNPSFVDLLKRVRTTALEAYTHQSLPFEQVVEALQPQRDLQHSPLFQAMFILQHAVHSPELLPNLIMEEFSLEKVTAKFDLTLSLWESKQQLLSTIEYNTDLFEVTTIEHMLSHWQILLQALVHNPAQPVTMLSLWQPAPLQQMLQVWTGPQIATPAACCLHHLFEEQARRTPDACAIIAGEDHLSYCTVNEQAQRLAGHLRAQGVGPDQLVGLCLPRSSELLLGVLAILKAGGAYVPLDPAYPQQWLEQVSKQAGFRVLLTQKSLRQSLVGTADVLLCLEDCQYETTAVQEAAISSSPDQLAYVIYTSGSTGVPKGVAMPHRGLVNLIEWQRHRSTVDLHSRTVQFTSISFDVSCQELFATWSTGGSLVLIDQQTRQDSQLLLQCLSEQAIERLFLPFIALHHLAQVAQQQGTSLSGTLCEVITAGEQLQVSRSLSDFFKQLPECRLANQYGPAETHVVTAYQLSPDPTVWVHLPPIGTVLSNCRVYVLDEYLQPVPMGARGELYLGGIGIARGYWQRADLTAERFLPDPFSPDEGARFYRTGDQVRSLADGTLEFVGRRDQQVKVRGYRIELEQIEAVIREHPAIRAAVVGVQQVGIGDKRLIAYIERQGEFPLTLLELRRYVGERLPEYMQPAGLVELDQLPLTASGKVDRRALAKWEVTVERGNVEEGKETHDELAELIRQVWQQVLQIEHIGVQENFFEIGGHSLLATQVMARIKKLVGVEIPLRVLFESPTVAGLAGRVRQALRQSEELQEPPVLPVSRNQPLPLSFAQQRLWFLGQLEPGSTVYTIPAAVRLHGQLDLRALEQALHSVILRHESLRTTFPSLQGEPIQQISSMSLTRLILLDLLHLLPETREEQVRQLAQQEVEQPFDLAHGPLLRCWLLRLTEQEHILFLVMHHIISDGWSSGILIREITTLYESLLRGKTAELPALPIQYADYALWQRAWLQGEVLERQLDYWKTQLAGLAPLDLPLDHPRPAIQTFRGARLQVLLPIGLSQELRALSQRAGVTLFMTLLASYQVLLARYSGQYDIAVGTPIANRTREEIEGLIGFFINTLVLRSNLSDNPSFIELLTRVRTAALGAYAHQDVPFEQVVEALQPQRDRSRSPLFQVVFVLQNTPEARISAEQSSVQMQEFTIERHAAQSELRMVVIESEQGLHTTLEYNTDLFDEATIARWLFHWQQLLEEIVTRPEQHILALPILTAAEHTQMLVEWNSTQVDALLDEHCLHMLFEEQVQRVPEAIALTFEESQLSYTALNQRANQLAHYLRAQGVGPDVLVGLYVGRSLEMIVGLLGILKAGGAYVPLDPTYPTDRLNFMFQDTRVPFVLTSQQLRAQLPDEQATLICLDSDWSAIAHQPTTNPVHVTQPQHLAYVIYTSGSTGKPKGVLVQHQSVSAILTASIQACAIGRQERIAQCASFNFDASVLEIFLALLSGSTLNLVSAEINASGLALASLLQRQAVTVLCVTPSHLEILSTSELPALQTLLIGGETCPAQTLARWATGRRFFTVYGPTEASIQAIWMQRTAPYLAGSPIGHPLANVQVYLLDVYLQPVPIGVPGELYIGGVGVARGYLHRPDLTAERFIPDPFSSTPGQRLYSTGDLVRYAVDGTIEFLGRRDGQVKLRGHRIELGEIEAVLSQHPQVLQCVVVLKGEEALEKQLVAYVVLKQTESNASGTPGELRSYLQENVPDYMVPAHFVQLDAIPLTLNGKVDLKALPQPGRERQEVDGLVAPGNPIEEALVAIWADLLELDQVSTSDNFFELGGHSLLATQVITRIIDQVGVEIPLQTLFEEPTLAGLAARVQETLQQELEHAAPPIVEVSHDQPLPLSFAQQRLWFFNQLEPDSSIYNMPVALRLQGPLVVEALQQSWQIVIQRHEILRTTFDFEDGEAVQRIRPVWQAEDIFKLTDLSHCLERAQEQEIQRWIRQEALQIFDLTRGPLVHMHVLKLTQESYVLLVTMHHIVSDGWSMDIFLKEITILYNAFVQRKPSLLPPLPVQYADFAVWQRNWLQGEVMEKELAYWQQQLAGMPKLTELPLDHSRPTVQHYQGARQSIPFPSELTQRLRELSQQEGATLFMTLLSSFLVLLWRYSSQEDLVVGTPIANRSRLELERLIGFFANTLVLRTSLAGDPTFRELLARVRASTLGAYSHQDVPFEKLVETLQPERTTSYAPLLQVLFALPPTATTQSEFAGLTIQGEPTNGESSVFDLICDVIDDNLILEGRFTYNKDLFEPETIQRLLSHWLVVLENMVSDLDQQIGTFSLFTEGDLEQFFMQWKGAEDDNE